MHITNLHPWKFGDQSVWIRHLVERRACFLPSSTGLPVIQFSPPAWQLPPLTQSAAKVFSLLGWKLTLEKAQHWGVSWEFDFPCGVSGFLAWAHTTWLWPHTLLIKIRLWLLKGGTQTWWGLAASLLEENSFQFNRCLLWAAFSWADLLLATWGPVRTLLSRPSTCAACWRGNKEFLKRVFCHLCSVCFCLLVF